MLIQTRRRLALCRRRKPDGHRRRPPWVKLIKRCWVEEEAARPNFKDVS
jgi:hypothetical protein